MAQVSNDQTIKDSNCNNYNFNTQNPDIKSSCIKLPFIVKEIDK